MARWLTYLWGVALAGVVVLWIARPGLFNGEVLAESINALGAWSFAAFVVVSLSRGIFFMPSTPVVFAGGILFPASLWTVLAVSMAGIVLSAALLYRFPGYGGYDKWLEARNPERFRKLQVHLVKPHATWVVAAWALLPIVPTDLICYAAGLVRMPFRSMILGVVLGELPLVTAYVLLGHRMAAALVS